MADEVVEKGADACIKEMQALAQGRHYIDVYERVWFNKFL